MRRLLTLMIIIWKGNTLCGQELVMATYQYADNDRLANIQPLADYLGKALHLNVRVKSYPGVQSFIEGIQRDEVDIALINTFGYFLLQAASIPFNMEATAVLHVPEDAVNNYKTAVIAAPGIGIDSITQLAGISENLTLMLVNPGSTSGNLVPRLALNGTGIIQPELSFKRVAYAGNHRAAMDAVLQGNAEVAAIGSTEYFRHATDPAKKGTVKLLWLSEEIPLGPVLLHHRLSYETCERINRTLLDLHKTNYAALESVKNGWSEAKQADHYIKLLPDYYTPFRQQLGDARTMAAILKQFAN